MSYRLQLNTNFHYFKSDEDVKKFIDNINENAYYYAKYEDTDSEEFFKKIKHFPMNIFFKSSCTDNFYALMQIFEDINFNGRFLATIRDLEAERIIVFIVKPDNKISILYHRDYAYDEQGHLIWGKDGRLEKTVYNDIVEYDLKSYWED
jgi:hypothetical protein